MTRGRSALLGLALFACGGGRTPTTLDAGPPLAGDAKDRGNLHAIGPGAPLQSTRAELCGTLTFDAIPSGQDVHAVWPDTEAEGAGVMWVVDLQASGRLVLYGFDPKRYSAGA